MEKTEAKVAKKQTGLEERINRLQGILRALKGIDNRIDDLSGRLYGPRPEGVSETDSPPIAGYIEQIDDLAQQMEAKIVGIESQLSSLEDTI